MSKGLKVILALQLIAKIVPLLLVGYFIHLSSKAKDKHRKVEYLLMSILWGILAIVSRL